MNIAGLINPTTKMYKNLTKEQVDALFKKSDTNHDGKLSLNEFKDMMLKNQKDKK